MSDICFVELVVNQDHITAVEGQLKKLLFNKRDTSPNGSVSFWSNGAAILLIRISQCIEKVEWGGVGVMLTPALLEKFNDCVIDPVTNFRIATDGIQNVYLFSHHDLGTIYNSFTKFKAADTGYITAMSTLLYSDASTDVSKWWCDLGYDMIETGDHDGLISPKRKTTLIFNHGETNTIMFETDRIYDIVSSLYYNDIPSERLLDHSDPVTDYRDDIYDVEIKGHAKKYSKYKFYPSVLDAPINFLFRDRLGHSKLDHSIISRAGKSK